MEGSSHGLIEVLPRADLEGLANGYEIIMIVIGYTEASVTRTPWSRVLLEKLTGL
jgi:hypothetical protein